MIFLDEVNLKVKRRCLIEDGKMAIPYGHVVLLTGKSGCGKTTLLMEIGLLSNNAKMQYLFDGEQIDYHDEARRSLFLQNEIAFIFQDTYLFSHLSIIENIRFFAKMSNLEISDEQIHEKLDFVDLQLDFNTNVNQLSGGERQRLAIVCGLVKNAKLFIFDEPTAYLDEENKRIIFSIIKELAHQSNKMVLVASHDQDFIDVADDIYQIQDQSIIKIKETQYQPHDKEFQSNLLKWPVLKEYINKKSGKKTIIIGLILSVMLSANIISSVYSDEYYLANEKEILTKINYQGTVAKTDKKSIKISEQANIQRRLTGLECYPYVELMTNVYSNDKVLEMVPIIPYISNSINDVDILKVNNDQDMNVYVSYEVQHLLNSDNLSEIRTNDGTIINISGVLKPTYISNPAIYVPFEMLENYYKSMNQSIHQLEVNRLTVKFNSLEDYQVAKSQIDRPYRLETKTDVSQQVRLSLLINSKHLQISWVLVILALFVLNGYRMYGDRKNLALLKTLGVNRRRMMQMKLYTELLMVVIMALISALLSGLLVQGLSIVNSDVLKQIVLSIGANAIIILSVDLILAYWFIRKYTVAMLLRKN